MPDAPMKLTPDQAAQVARFQRQGWQIAGEVLDEGDPVEMIFRRMAGGQPYEGSYPVTDRFWILSDGSTSAFDPEGPQHGDALLRTTGTHEARVAEVRGRVVGAWVVLDEHGRQFYVVRDSDRARSWILT